MIDSVEFEEAGATPMLELLVFEYTLERTSSISGLSSLSSLKEVVIKGGAYRKELMGSVRDQVTRNQNSPVLKEWCHLRMHALRQPIEAIEFAASHPFVYH